MEAGNSGWGSLEKSFFALLWLVVKSIFLFFQPHRSRPGSPTALEKPAPAAIFDCN